MALQTSPAFTGILRPGEQRSILEHDMELYGWSVVWEFASYVTDRMIEEDFGYPRGTVSQWSKDGFAPGALGPGPSAGAGTQ
jgi:hypothetical protein